MTFEEIVAQMKEAVDGIRKAVYGVQVREYIAKGMENVVEVGKQTIGAAKAAKASEDAAKTSQAEAKKSEAAAKKYAGDAAAIANTDKTLTISGAAADAASTGVRIKMLEMTLGVDVSGISFVSAFDTLDGVELTGVWNKAASRVEF